MIKGQLSAFLMFLLGFSAVSQTYYGTTGVIPDDGTTKTFIANVSGLPVLGIDSAYGLESVCVTVLHPWISDIDLALMAPDSTYIFLTSAMGGGEDNYFHTCFNGNSEESIIRAFAPFTGDFRPMGDLGRVNNGQDGNGVWKLLVQDIYPWADQGVVLGWGLNFGNEPSLAQPLLNSYLPIVVINTEGQFIPDDPKLAAHMGIIDNGPGELNHVTDAFNAYDGPIGIERRGSSSQSFPKKSFGLETWDSAGNSINVSLLGMPEESDWILNANYNDKSLQRNVLTYCLSNRMGMYASRSKYCELVLNGQYWGAYIFMEKIKRANNRVDISKLTQDDTTGTSLTGGYILKIDKTTGTYGGGWESPYPPVVHPNGQTIFFQYEYPKSDELLACQVEYIQAYVDTFETALYGAEPTPGFTYKDFMDLPSFVDYFILNEISRNVDGYRLSTFFYKDRGGKLMMGPVWDFDIAWDNADYCEAFNPAGWAYEFGDYCSYDYWQVPFWWSRLLADTAFTNPLKCRWEELRPALLSEDSIFAAIDSLAGNLEGAQERNFVQWPILGMYVWPNPWPFAETYKEEVDGLKSWITQRLSWLDANMPGICNSTGFGVMETGDESPQIYPNPFHDRLKISLPEKLQPGGEAGIYDILGTPAIERIDLSGDREVNVSTTSLPPGIYLVRIMTRDGCVVRKAVKR